MWSDGTMKVILDLALCQGHGQCTVYAPDHFRLDDETGLALLLKSDVEPNEIGALEDAIQACPVRAITMVEG